MPKQKRMKATKNVKNHIRLKHKGGMSRMELIFETMKITPYDKKGATMLVDSLIN